MTNTDLGIDKDGRHHLELTLMERSCFGAIEGRGLGRAAAISAGHLSCSLGLYGETGKRKLRHLINHLIMSHKLPIMCEAGTGGGHYLPGCADEVARFKKAYHRRSMTGLVKMSRGSKAAYVDMMMQYTLGFDDPETQAVMERLSMAPDEDPVPVWVQLATRLLDRFSSDPVRYAEEIRKLQITYGDIFVPREKVSMLKQKTAEFQKLLSEIA